MDSCVILIRRRKPFMPNQERKRPGRTVPLWVHLLYAMHASPEGREIQALVVRLTGPESRREVLAPSIEAKPLEALDVEKGDMLCASYRRESPLESLHPTTAGALSDRTPTWTRDVFRLIQSVASHRLYGSLILLSQSSLLHECE